MAPTGVENESLLVLLEENLKSLTKMHSTVNDCRSMCTMQDLDFDIESIDNHNNTTISRRRHRKLVELKELIKDLKEMRVCCDYLTRLYTHMMDNNAGLMETYTSYQGEKMDADFERDVAEFHETVCDVKETLEEALKGINGTNARLLKKKIQKLIKAVKKKD